MLSYDECKAIAEGKANIYNATINEAYSIGNDFSFDADKEIIGVFPAVVEVESGHCCGLWHYLNKNDLTMDDMKVIEL